MMIALVALLLVGCVAIGYVNQRWWHRRHGLGTRLSDMFGSKRDHVDE